MSYADPDPSAAPTKRGSDGPFVSYSALPGDSGFGTSGNSTLYSSPPSAYEFSIFSRDSLLPAESSPDPQHKTNGPEWMKHGWKSHTAYQQLGPGGADGRSLQHRSPEDGRPQSVWAWLSFWFSLLAGILWIVPIVALLVLNFQGYIIGASAWCPNGYCPGQSSDPTQSTASMTAQYDRDTHNLLGGLQFAAKAAEVWFVAVAASLVWLVTSALARSEHGLPIGYLTAYTEFTDVLYLFKPTLWTSARSAPGQRGTKHKRRATRYYLFGLLVAFTCIVANLVGPLVAVLMIPTLQWVDMPTTSSERFGGMLAAAAPAGDDAITGCTAGNLTAARYDCTCSYYMASLESLFEYFLTDYAQTWANPADVTAHTPSPSREQALAIRFNASKADNAADDADAISWAPNRQVVKALTQDLWGFYNASKNPQSQYAQYNNSLHLTLQRRGPIIGYQYSWIGTNVTVTSVAPDKSIRCYQHCYWDQTDDLDPKPYAKCFRVGTGWNETNAIANFTLAEDAPSENSTMNVNGVSEAVVTQAFFADRALWVQTELIPGADMPDCLPNGTAPSSGCDYDELFAAPPPPAIPANLSAQSTDAFVVENTMASDPTTALVIEGHYALGFTTYAADVSGFSPSWGLVEIDAFPDAAALRPLAVHPAWLLAAWSVAPGGNVPWSRAAARQVQLTTSNLHTTLATDAGRIASNGSDYDQILWSLAALNVGLQTASLVPYSHTDPRTDGLSTAADDPLHPQLWNNVRRQVWAFGLDTRTAKLAVACMGVAVALVLARSALMLATRARHRDPPEMMVAAMKHTPRGEFEAAGNSQMRMERVRFEIRDDAREHIHFAKR